MPSTRRGRRNPATLERRRSQWLESGGLDRAKEALAQRTTTFAITPAEYPGHFIGAPNDAVVTEKVKTLFPGLIPHNLPSVTEEGRFLIPTPFEILSQYPLHPPYLVGRFDRMVKDGVKDSLITSWDELNRLGVHYPKADRNRVTTPALHLGVWELYGLKPRITGHSKNQLDNVITAMDRFLRLIGNQIAPKILNILRSHYPQQFHRQLLAYDRVTTLLAAELANRPALNFRGAFFIVAATEGSSENIHLDFNDHLNGIAWIVPIGDWEGGEFCIPQLNIKVPIRSGQILGAMTRLLAHCSAPVTNGRRLVLTLSTDKYLLDHSS